MNSDIRKLLEGVQSGSLSVEDALLQLKQEPFAELGYAKVDLHRRLRQGAGEVIYGEGKTAEQIAGILAGMRENGQKNVLITRMSQEKADAVLEASGAGAAFSGAVRNVKALGHIVLVGNAGRDLTLQKEDYAQILRKQLTISGSWNSDFGEKVNDLPCGYRLFLRRANKPQPVPS